MGLEAKLINTVNNYSRTNSKAIIDEAEKAGGAAAGFKYIYIGPVDERTIDICMEMAAAGETSLEEIKGFGWEDSLREGGGFNCRHNWEISAGGGYKKEAQFNFEEEAKKQLKAREEAKLLKKVWKSDKEAFKTYQDAKDNTSDYWEALGDDPHEEIAGTRPASSDPDVKAIQEYTASNRAELINEVLRGDYPDKRFSEGEISFFEGEADKMKMALDDAPKFEGKSYRGVFFDDSELKQLKGFQERMQEGSIFSSKQFYSTSGEQGIAESFLERDKHNSSNLPAAEYLLEIRGKTGVAIRDIAAFEFEEEVLFAPGTLFKVVKVKESSPDVFKIILQEI